MPGPQDAAAAQQAGGGPYELWHARSLPTYMQQGNIVEFCQGWEEGVLRADIEGSLPAAATKLVWLVIR